MILQRLLQLLFPEKCVLCRELLSKDEMDLCRKCRTEAPRYHRGRGKIRFVKEYTAAWFYEDQVRESLIRYKFSRARHYASAYGRAVAMAVEQNLPEEIDLITYVPVSPKRKLERGYDQVELLAKAVSQETGIPMVPLLKKVRDNPPQSGIDRPEVRRANVLGAYESINNDRIRGSSILLLDDIITTGSTVSECARVLQGAQAKNVYCAAVAVSRNQKQ